MEAGIAIRLQRIFRGMPRALIVPLDHGLSLGPLPGLADMRETMRCMALGGADAVVLHKGLIPHVYREHACSMGLLLHLSASTEHAPQPNSKVLVSSVEEALQLGADGVSVHITLGDAHESAMLADLGRTVRTAHEWGLPVLAMVYARGMNIDPLDAHIVAHSARVAFELGADIIKVPYTGTAESFCRVTEAVCVPVLIAGGIRTDAVAFLHMVHDALSAGAAGISIGRNIFQSPQPVLLLQALRGLLHAGWTVDAAQEYLAQTGGEA